MDKMKMQSKDRIRENFEKLKALFPNAVTETITGYDKDGNAIIERAIDKDVLQQEISAVVVEGRDERYQFTWPDKKKSILAANAPIRKTLRPCREESLDFDNTRNLYIEGDNLDVLKLMQETYLGKIKLIYIDPPYNTGHDFVYNDTFTKRVVEYTKSSGQLDDEGNRLFRNTESNGRFHTDWLNMLYPRLKIARDLLSDDGVIFISIDDNEAENLKKCCHEIFGDKNFLAQVVWERAFSPINLKKHFSESHDYILVYAKQIDSAVCNGLPRSAESDSRYANPDDDPRGVWTSGDLSVGPRIESRVYEITTPSGKKVLPPSGYCWRLDKSTFEKYVDDNRIWFGENGDNVPRIKRFLSEVKQGVTPMTIWKHTEVGHSQDATKGLKELFDGKAVFDYPKPVELIKRCIRLYSDSDSIILDFFSGSATTAHAVMELNAEDGGKRQFIMVQTSDPCDKKSDAIQAGFKSDCDIGRERIRRAGKQIMQNAQCKMQNNKGAKAGEKSDSNHNYELCNMNAELSLDVGFRVLKLDSTNMKDVYYNPHDVRASLLDSLENNIKEDRTPEDLLFQVMLDLGILLSSKIEECEVWSVKSGVDSISDSEKTPHSTLNTPHYKYYSVADGFLIACFDENIDESVITEIAKKHPTYFVMRDSSAKNDSVLSNIEQIFADVSPSTERKCL